MRTQWWAEGIALEMLTHWGRATHICVSKLTIIASDNGLLPGRRQAIIWINAGILSIELLGTNFNEILIEILTFSFKKMRLKVSSAKGRLFSLGLNELNQKSGFIIFSLWLPQMVKMGVFFIYLLLFFIKWYSKELQLWLSDVLNINDRSSRPIMMTSSNGNIFRVTGHLCGEFTGHRWISFTKASDA